MIYLTLQPVTPVSHPYVLEDDDSLFITFATAQEAFDWIANYLSLPVQVNLQPLQTTTTNAHN